MSFTKKPTIEEIDMDAYLWRELECEGIICAITGTLRKTFKVMELHAGLANRSEAQPALFLASGQFTDQSYDLILAEQSRRAKS